MVGLPARGKTRIARRIQNYLAFFHGVTCVNVNVGDHRRALCGKSGPEFFDYSKDEQREAIQQCREAAMTELLGHLRNGDETTRVCFFDGHNVTAWERKWIMDQLTDTGCTVLFLECVCNDPQQVIANMKAIHENSPDYERVTLEEAMADLKARSDFVKDAYEPLDHDGSEKHLPWIRVTDMERYEVNNVHGYLHGRIAQLVMNLQPGEQRFFLSRHGQSEYNIQGKIGGDAPLTEEGMAYARKLGEYAVKTICHDPELGTPTAARLWTSTLARTRQTASFVPHAVITRQMPQPRGNVEWVQMRAREWPNLDEIYAGDCDGMTYEEIAEQMPKEFELRSRDKLGYRYPRGESYLDVCHRLEPVIMEMERIREPLLVVAHQGILRLIYAYFMGVPREEAPYVSIPLNTVIQLRPQVYGCIETRELLHTSHKHNSDGQAEPGGPPHGDRIRPATSKDHGKALEPLSFSSYVVDPPPRLVPASPSRERALEAARTQFGPLVRDDTKVLVEALQEGWEEEPPSI